MGDALYGGARPAEHIAIAPRKMALHTAGHSWTQLDTVQRDYRPLPKSGHTTSQSSNRAIAVF